MLELGEHEYRTLGSYRSVIGGFGVYFRSCMNCDYLSILPHRRLRDIQQCQLC